MNCWTLHCQQDEGNQRDARHPVGLESIGAGSDRVAGVVAGAIGDYAGIARIIFLDLEDNFHQVRADVRNLGEYAAGNTQSRSAQRFTNGKSDEARAGIISRNKEQDEQHDKQLDAHQQRTDAHPGLQWDGINRIWFPAETRESSPRVSECVYADAKPRHPIAATNSNQAEEQDDNHPL